MSGEWMTIAEARERDDGIPVVTTPLTQTSYQEMSQHGQTPASHYQLKNKLFNTVPAMHDPFLPPQLVRADVTAMAAHTSLNLRRNVAGSSSGGSDPCVFGTDARTVQRDMVRLISSWLTENGFTASALTLADEAESAMRDGYHFRKMLRTLARFVDAGNWDSAHQVFGRWQAQLATTTTGHTSNTIPVCCVERGIDFLISRQQYFEAIENGNGQQAAAIFQRRLAKFENFIGREAYMLLSSLLTCRSISTDAARLAPKTFRGWSTAKGRALVIAELLRHADGSLLDNAYSTELAVIPERGELATMVGEALSYRLLRSNPSLVSGVVHGGASSCNMLTSILRNAPAGPLFRMVLPPSRVLLCIDLNVTVDESSADPAHVTPYTLLGRSSTHTDVHRFSLASVHGPVKPTASPTHITTCVPLLGFSGTLFGTRDGDVVLVTFGEPPMCEVVTKVSGRVWAMDVAVVAPPLPGDLCHRPHVDDTDVTLLNGGAPDIFVAIATAHDVSLFNMKYRRVVRRVHLDDIFFDQPLSMTHAHRLGSSEARDSVRSGLASSEYISALALFTLTASQPFRNALSLGDAPPLTADEAPRCDEGAELFQDHCCRQSLMGAVGSSAGDVIVFDAMDNDAAYRARVSAAGVTSLVFSSHGNRLFIGAADGSISVLDVAHGVILSRFGSTEQIAGSRTEVTSMCVSSNGSLLFVAFLNGSVHLYDILTSKKLPIRLVGYSGSHSTRLCCGASSNTIACASDDGFMYVWDVSGAVCSSVALGVAVSEPTLTPSHRIPLRLGSAVLASSRRSDELIAPRHLHRLTDAISALSYDRTFDKYVLASEDGKIFFVGP